MHYTKLFYYSESVSKVVLFQNFNFSLLSVYGLMHGQNLLLQSTDTNEHLVTFDWKVNFISVTTE